MAQALDVKCFGAVGDGVTDDSVAIRNAITAAAMTCRAVFFSPGTYLVSSDGTNAYCIAPPSGMTFCGVGGGASVVKMDVNQPAQTRIFSLINVSDVTLRDLALDGNKAGQPADEHKHGLFLMGAARVMVERVECRHFLGDGISTFTGTSELTVRDCHIHDCDRDGIAFTGSAEHVLIDHCHIHAIAAQPIDSEPEPGPVSHVVIRNCWIVADENQLAITTGGTTASAPNTDWVIDGNTITGSIDVIRVEDIRIVNNAITGDQNANAAISGRYHSARVFVTGNAITVTSMPAVAIVASTGEIPNRWIVSGNTIDMAGAGNAILVQGAASAHISGNFITGAGGGYGVNVFATTPLETLIITGNTIIDVGVALYFARYETNVIKRIILGQNSIAASVGVMLIGVKDAYDALALNANIISAATSIQNTAGVRLVF